MHKDQPEPNDQSDDRAESREGYHHQSPLRTQPVPSFHQIIQSPLVSPNSVSAGNLDANSHPRALPPLKTLSSQMGSAGARRMIKDEEGGGGGAAAAAAAPGGASIRHHPTLPFPSSRRSSSSLHSTSPFATRADAFMASLLRAASSDKDDSSSRRPSSPMSVSSIVDSTPTAAAAFTNDSSTRLNKRKSSSSDISSNQQALEGKMTNSEQVGAFDVKRRHQMMMQPYDRFAELYQKLANSNPAAVAARSNPSTPFQPTPLYMSMSNVTSPLPLSESSTSSSSSQRATSSAISPTFQSSDWNHRTLQQKPVHRGMPLISSHTSSSHDSRSSPESCREQMRLGGSRIGSSLLTTPSTTTSGNRDVSNSSQDQTNRSFTTLAEDEQKWAEMAERQKREKIQSNILFARADLVQKSADTARWPPNNTAMTSIRCSYANIAQKSYGSEKRFLCPPPEVKIDGPLRSCRWACARVVSGDSPTPSSISMRSVPEEATVGEEEAILDAKREARFGKLHVGSLSESRGKTFRLQINLLRSLEGQEELNKRSTVHHDDEDDDDQGHPSRAIALGAWSTFHTAPISVISKPARKSAKTRAASPAIASGSIVCLYNRLNSQTVRTKYLAVESSSSSSTTSMEGSPDVRRLIARQDGWEGFAIDLLARPLQDLHSGRASQSSSWVNDSNRITYGCIICLRDINANVCSDPMLICKVEKGKVDISNLLANTKDGKLRFQIVGEDRDAAKEILLGGTRRIAATSSERKSLELTEAESSKKRESAESSNESTLATKGIKGGEASSNIGGAVIQMQKVTFMHVTPRASSLYSDEFECDLNQSRPYLCSTAFEGNPDNQTSAALVRSRYRLQERMQAVERQAIIPDEEEDTKSCGKPRMSSNTLLSYPVGFVLPPTATWNNANGPMQVDMLEDPFCWTIVTISRSEVSFLEANLPQSIGSPLIPYSPLPITPFPSVAAVPSYDRERHSIAATIHDFHYRHDIQNTFTNNVCAMGSPSMRDSVHEIWLGHSGPLQVRSTSAGPYMSDVSIQLPSIAELLALHLAFHQDSQGSNERGLIKVIQLPILFVRASQGITFLSNHWLQATNVDSDPQSRLAWEFSIK